MKKIYFLIVLGALQASAQIIDFADANFKAKLLTSGPGNGMAENLLYESFAIDANGDGEISQEEALQVSRLSINSSFVADLGGLEFFTNLELFSCSYNPITTLNLSVLPHLTYCFASSCEIQSLTLNSAIKVLSCAFNQLTVLDVSQSPQLENITCWGNQLTVLDVLLLPNLKQLNCQDNLLTTLDFSQTPHLDYVNCSFNAITSINLTGVEPLGGSSAIDFTIDCSNNNLTSIDTSVMINAMPQVTCDNNPNLLYIDVTNGAPFFDPCCILPPEAGLFFSGTPNLQHICADEMNFDYIQAKIDQPNYTNPNCTLDDSCSLGVDGANVVQLILFPNPATDILHISSSADAVGPATIYNMMGQLVMEISGSGAQQTLDVSPLQTGQYFIKVSSERGSAVSKFVKQ